MRHERSGLVRKIRGIFGVTAFIVLMGVNAAFADSAVSDGLLSKLNLDITVSGTMDFYNQYIWRGFALETDPVFQPGFSMSGYGFTFNFWSSWDTDNSDALNGDEIDYIVDYSKQVGKVKLSVGHTYYDFPGSSTFSKEFYAGAALTSVLFTPTVTYYYDYGTHHQGGGHGQYATLKLSHSVPLLDDPAITLNMSVLTGFNYHLFIRGTGGNTLLTTGLTIPLTKSLTCSPNVNYSIPFGDLADKADGNQKKRFFGGVSFAYAF